MKERALRFRCRDLLQDLDVQPPLDVTALCEAFGRRRGFPIRLVGQHMPMPGPFGVWVRTGNADYVAYPLDTSPVHQNHVILHEVGHMISGHDGDGHNTDFMSVLFPHLDPKVVRTSLQRSHYDTRREREAELAATIILEWASVLEHVGLHARAPFVQDRLERALGDRVGWL